MDKIKIGVVGIRRGGTYVKVFHNTGRSQITAICDLDEAHLEAARQEIGLREDQCFTDYDAFVQSGNGPGISYNRNKLFYRIDHILHSQSLDAYRCAVDRSVQVSDHYPISCYLKKAK